MLEGQVFRIPLWRGIGDDRGLTDAAVRSQRRGNLLRGPGAGEPGGSLGVLREMVAALVPEDVEEPYRELLAGGQKLLPTAAEMEGMFGVGVSTVRATDDGISLQTAWELPAP